MVITKNLKDKPAEAPIEESVKKIDLKTDGLKNQEESSTERYNIFGAHPNRIEELEVMIKENMKMTREVYWQLKKVKNQIKWMNIFAALRFLLIVIPLILALIYLPPLIKNMLAPYQELLNENSNMPAGVDLKNLNLNNLPDTIQKLLQQNK